MDDPIVLTELSSIYRDVFITPESVEALGYEFEGGEKKNYDGYKLVSSLEKVDYASTEILIRFDGILYGKSNAIIDYAGGSEQIGTINKFVASQYVPKLDNETNTLSLMNAKVYDKAEKSIIILDFWKNQ